MECRINEANLNDSRNKKLPICESSNSLKESCQKARKILNLALSVSSKKASSLLWFSGHEVFNCACSAGSCRAHS